MRTTNSPLSNKEDILESASEARLMKTEAFYTITVHIKVIFSLKKKIITRFQTCETKWNWPHKMLTLTKKKKIFKSIVIIIKYSVPGKRIYPYSQKNQCKAFHAEHSQHLQIFTKLWLGYWKSIGKLIGYVLTCNTEAQHSGSMYLPSTLRYYRRIKAIQK